MDTSQDCFVDLKDDPKYISCNICGSKLSKGSKPTTLEKHLQTKKHLKELAKIPQNVPSKPTKIRQNATSKSIFNENSSFDENKLESLFSKYKDPNEKDRITMEGVIKFLGDLQLDPSSIQVRVLTVVSFFGDSVKICLSVLFSVKSELMCFHGLYF